MDKDTLSLVDQVRGLLSELRQRGVPEDVLLGMVGKPKVGKLALTPVGLKLPDWGDLLVRLTPMERTLYILILRYPGGIRPDDLWMYYDELCDIYGSQTVYDDPELIKDAVESLCDGYKGALYTNISRIKRKLVDKLGAMASEPYVISKDKRGMYTISVPRNLVVGI